MWEKGIVPGPTKLLEQSSLQAGYYGEVPAKDFITGDELARRIGLTAGVSQFSDEPWLKFVYLGKIEFVAMKPFRYSISWNDINAVGAVFGNKTINVRGNRYKIRLMKGKTEGMQDDQSAYGGTICHNSEWNRLMYPIHLNMSSGKWRYKLNLDDYIYDFGYRYDDKDLLTDEQYGKGSISWCQECGDSTESRLFRGEDGVSCSYSYPADFVWEQCGWRPVLELVD